MAHKEVFVLLLVSMTASALIDYCEIECDGKEHIGCNATEALGSGCPEGAQIYKYTQSDIDLWLGLDNNRRNQIANGSLPGYDPASRMSRTTWNAELAELALYNAKSCNFDHDKCRNTEQYKYAGQSIGRLGLSSGYYSTEEAIRKVHDEWFDEYKDASMKDIQSFPANSPKPIGHFTQIIRDKSPQFGCAATKYKKNSFHYWYIVCDYGTGNILGYPVYQSGAIGQECTTGRDETYPGLCGPNETIDPNHFKKP